MNNPVFLYIIISRARYTLVTIFTILYCAVAVFLRSVTWHYSKYGAIEVVAELCLLNATLGQLFCLE
jgi:hypothetical protein